MSARITLTNVSDLLELKTPEEWCSNYKVKVITPTGWHRAGKYKKKSFHEPITLSEFDTRLNVSTIVHSSNVMTETIKQMELVEIESRELQPSQIDPS